jgi:hypothetical protein
MQAPFNSFVDFVEAVVFPLLLQHPQHARLDGWESGGNWEVVGRFRFEGNVWRVHADNHYEPLLLAYYSAKFRPAVATFLRADTDKGIRLDLVPELEALRPSRRGNARYLYVYLDE